LAGCRIIVFFQTNQRAAWGNSSISIERDDEEIGGHFFFE
jgi:hypothetical protein